MQVMFCGYYIYKIMVVVYALIKAGVSFSQMFSGYYLVVTWSGKLPLWLSYAISKIYST